MDDPERRQPNDKNRRRKVMQRIAILLIMIGAAGLVGGIWTYVDQPEPPAQSGADKTRTPSSTKPSKHAIDAYRVAPDVPKYIEIPTIHVATTRTIQLGLMKNNEIAVPDNVYDAGWYKASAKPGKNGAMFIFGHVSSWQAKGVFYNLKKLQPGDKVYITRGDNRQFTYRVLSKKMYDHTKVDMRTVLAPIEPGKPGLNLMTCAGHVIKGTNEFSERLVVFATLE